MPRSRLSRAGAAGSGFAVVATEVKELARKTAEATEDIRHRIEGIQTSSNEAVDAIGRIGAVIDQVKDVSRTIASAVEEQSITTREIARKHFRNFPGCRNRLGRRRSIRVGQHRNHQDDRGRR